jgi:NAD(P)H-dependent FMN reductase
MPEYFHALAGGLKSQACPEVAPANDFSGKPVVAVQATGGF